MAKQQSLLEKYEQRLQRTTTGRPTIELAATENATGTHERVHTSLGSKYSPVFRIQGRTRPHHRLGYESPGSKDRSTEGEETLSSIEDTPSFQEFAREQVLAKQNPHGSEALKNMQDRLSANFRQQRKQPGSMYRHPSGRRRTHLYLHPHRLVLRKADKHYMHGYYI
ncbi:hypothetical protein SARC_04591 [Sphaeroforma arctica JP610]|uniref:Uncharacterized protein n=1 Tax=Sphaeroforma arctica JP610 TaxID=667725 RepID=A0A0L0G244_9EUKA|nr:hypothetical protein SARC_04591 [Sphaeroforma arctica JP610]KNC83140.1 hypothetical protein SARC_04591 [Sphaeroforma arctica JP610]|eukprot:XP_014157042.1 hypothetical protein SARC_04591 [Sphaeroforma arctica JP610]